MTKQQKPKAGKTKIGRRTQLCGFSNPMNLTKDVICSTAWLKWFLRRAKYMGGGALAVVLGYDDIVLKILPFEVDTLEEFDIEEFEDPRLGENIETALLDIFNELVSSKMTINLMTSVVHGMVGKKVIRLLRKYSSDDKHVKEFTRKLDGKEFMPQPLKLIVTKKHPSGDLHSFLEDNRMTTDMWRSILFQVLHVNLVLQKMYPGFRHNDMHLGNIIIERQDGNNVYVYSVGKNKYYIQGSLIAKLMDFDWANLPGTLEDDNIKLDDFDKYGRTAQENEKYDIHHFLNMLKNGCDEVPNIPAKCKEVRAFLNDLFPENAWWNGQSGQLLKDYRFSHFYLIRDIIYKIAYERGLPDFSIFNGMEDELRQSGDLEEDEEVISDDSLMNIIDMWNDYLAARRQYQRFKCNASRDMFTKLCMTVAKCLYYKMDFVKRIYQVCPTAFMEEKMFNVDFLENNNIQCKEFPSVQQILKHPFFDPLKVKPKSKEARFIQLSSSV
jgi:hypothetical protein